MTSRRDIPKDPTGPIPWSFWAFEGVGVVTRGNDVSKQVWDG